MSQTRNQHGYLLHALFLLVLFFDPEDGDDIIPRNIG
jgi:hypothetical protein